MKALKSLNICYKKNLNDEFSNHVSSFTNNLFEVQVFAATVLPFRVSALFQKADGL